MAAVAGYGQAPHYQQQQYNGGSSLYSSSGSQSSVQQFSEPPLDDDQYTALFCKALYDYTAQDASALSFQKGDIIEVLTQQPSGWWDGLLGEERGWFPSNYVVVISEEEAELTLGAQEANDPEAPVDFGAAMLRSSSMAGEEWLGDSEQSGNNSLMALAEASLAPDEDNTKASDFWMPEVTADGQVFYVNHQTGQRSRDLPREAEEETAADNFSGFQSQASFTSGIGASSAYASPTLLSSVHSPEASAGFGFHRRTDTPEPWVRKLADDGRSYYYWNQETDQVQWTRPDNTLSSPYTGDQPPPGSGRPSPNGLRSETAASGRLQSHMHSRPLSVYSDDSEIQPPELSHIASSRSATRNGGSRASPTAAPTTPYADYEYLSHALQNALALPPPEILVELSTSARDAIQAVMRTATAAAGSQPYDIVPEGKDDKLDAAVRLAVIAVRDLLYVAAAPTGHVPSNVFAHGESTSLSPSSQAALKPAQRRVTATLSKLVLSARAMEYEYGSSGSDAPSRIESDADELDRAVVSFVAEAERHSITRQNEQRLPRRLNGVFLPLVFNMGAAGSGCAGTWTGFGFAGAENEPQAGKKLDSEVLAEMDSWSAAFDQECRSLIDAMGSGIPEGNVRTSLRDIISQLSVFSSFVANIHVSSHVDIDGMRDSGPIANDTYTPLVDRARQLVRTLEAVLQSVYDGFSSVPYKLKAIQVNLSLVRQTLGSIQTLGEKQAAAASEDFSASIKWRRSRASVYAPHESFQGNSFMPESEDGDVIGMDDAFAKRAPRKPQVAPDMISTSSMSAHTELSEPYSDAGAYDDEPLEADDLLLDELDEGKKPQRSGGKDLTQFLGKDAPKHIVNRREVEALPWYLKPNTVDIVLDGDGSIRGGTLAALVERLTAHDAADSTFNKTFLMTFKSFTTVNELFDLLVERFYIQPPPKLTHQEREQWDQLKQHIVRMRVLNTFKSMISDEDVLQQEDLVIFGRMKEFLSREEVANVPAAKHLSILIGRGRGKEAVQRKITALQAPPPPIIPKNNKKPKLLDIDPLELARQLTIMESELYQKITPVECIQRARESKDDYNDSIAQVIQTSNRIADWVAESILNKDDSRRRAACLKQFIAVADKCRMLQNFSTMVAITSGLNTTPIRRLKRTWEHVPPKSMAMLASCERVLESARNYNSYRSAMANVTPPCVPFIGVFLTTLTFIQDGAKDNLPGNMINYRKRTKAAEVIQDIKRWQAQPFLFTPVPSVLAYLDESLRFNENQGDVRDLFWNLSLEREPREREDERMARLLQESGFL